MQNKYETSHVYLPAWAAAGDMIDTFFLFYKNNPIKLNDDKIKIDNDSNDDDSDEVINLKNKKKSEKELIRNLEDQNVKLTVELERLKFLNKKSENLLQRYQSIMSTLFNGFSQHSTRYDRLLKKTIIEYDSRLEEEDQQLIQLYKNESILKKRLMHISNSITTDRDIPDILKFDNDKEINDFIVIKRNKFACHEILSDIQKMGQSLGIGGVVVDNVKQLDEMK